MILLLGLGLASLAWWCDCQFDMLSGVIANAIWPEHRLSVREVACLECHGRATLSSAPPEARSHACSFKHISGRHSASSAPTQAGRPGPRGGGWGWAVPVVVVRFAKPICNGLTFLKKQKHKIRRGVRQGAPSPRKQFTFDGQQ